MEISLIYALVVWLIFNTIALILMFFRDDVDKYINEANFILTKGTFAHKVTFVVMTWLVLSFTIPYSLNKIVNKNKKNK